MIDWVKFLEITYSVLLTAGVGSIFALLKNQIKNKKLHVEMTEKIIGKLETIETKVDENEMKASRYRIIRFDDELTRGRTPSSDHWEQIIEDIDLYQTYCDNHPRFVNHKAQNSMKRILKEYEGRQIV